MPTRQQPRHIARELALLSQGQLSRNPDKLAKHELHDVVLAAVRALTGEIEDALEFAAEEIKRGNERIFSSETQATSVQSARAMVSEAIEMTQTAINRVGAAVELPEIIQLANQQEVRDYTIEILSTLGNKRPAIDQQIADALVEWQLNRLSQIDRALLRIAVTEMSCLNVPDRVAINEAVELAKRYSDDEGHRFINGVLRRVSDQTVGGARGQGDKGAEGQGAEESN